jgi:hypothetical protein
MANPFEMSIQRSRFTAWALAGWTRERQDGDEITNDHAKILRESLWAYNASGASLLTAAPLKKRRE